jgi:hypothetical protein
MKNNHQAAISCHHAGTIGPAPEPSRGRCNASREIARDPIFSPARFEIGGHAFIFHTGTAQSFRRLDQIGDRILHRREAE